MAQQESSSPRLARTGDVVTIRLHMAPENGYVPEPLFDTSGVISFILGWGNYLPGLHELVEGLRVGDSVENLSVDAGWGDRQDELVVKVQKEKLSDFAWKLGESFLLKGMHVWVTEDLGDAVVLDANPPLAGASFSCTFTVLSIEDAPPTTRISNPTEAPRLLRYELASFALGCFWGAELAFSRLEGVVGTRVGYSHGITPDPTYDEVCEGRTQHRETVLVVYDPKIVSYRDLLHLALERLAVTSMPLSNSSTGLNRLFGEGRDDAASSMQYRHGFYYYTEQQRIQASEEVNRVDNRFGIELLQADTFYEAEDYHQQYLYKRGQSTRKGSRETIRCYG